MSVIRIGSIVEGHSEVKSLPILLSRIARSIDPWIALALPEPIRVPRDMLLGSDGALLKALRLATGRAEHLQPVLILIDGEGKCPAELGPTLRRRAQVHCPGRPMGCVIAHQEYEAWFLAAPECIRNHFELDATPLPPPDPESRRGAKEWIRQQLPRGKTYKETVDQPALTRLLDLDRARSIASFDKLYREVARLIREAQGTNA